MRKGVKNRHFEKHPILIPSPKTHNAINLGSTPGFPEEEADNVAVEFKYNGTFLFMKVNGSYSVKTLTLLILFFFFF
jgi:hypothetical protein